MNRMHCWKPYWLALILLVSSIAGATEFQTLDLSGSFNNDGISYDTNRRDGNFDAIGDYSPGTFNLAAEEMPASNSVITTFGIPFLFPDKSDGKMNNILCKGETISVSKDIYSALYILGASVNGSYEEPLILHYGDKTMETTKLALSDWCTQPQYGELPAISASYRQMRTGRREPTENHLWLQSVLIDTSKELTAIQLPDSQSLHVFALTLGSGDRINLSDIILPIPNSGEDKKFAMVIQQMQPGNVYYTGETARFRLTVKNIPESVKSMYLHWQLTNIDNKIVTEKKEFLTRWQNGGFIYPIQANDNHIGWYQLQVTLENDSEKLLQTRTNLAWVPPVTPVENSLMSKTGMGLGFAHLSDNGVELSGQLAELAGIKWIREEFGWGQIQPQPKKWDWSDYDISVDAAKRYHLHILGLLDYWTGWSKPYTEEGYKQYAKYVYEVVNRYKDKVKYWEIWNEPNIFYWKGTPEQYFQLLKLAYQSAKKADPKCKIIACTTAGVDTKFIEQVLKAGGWDYLDGISVHPYRQPYPDQHNLAADLIKVRELMQQYGKSSHSKNNPKELWVTEIGWWTNLTDKPGGVTYPVQAACLVRSYIVACYAGVANKIFWYTYRDPGSKGGYSEDNFGILTHDFTPKPAYVALATMTRQLNGYSYVSTLGINNDVVAYLFQKENQKLIVAWHKSASATLGIQSDANSLNVTDLYGNTKTLLATNGVVPVTISDMPVYISGNFTEIKGLARILDLHIPVTQVRQGQGLDLGIQLKNIFSKDLIGNLAVKISDKINQQLYGDETSDTITIKPGEEKELKYKLHISDTSVIGLSPLEVRMDTKDGGTFRLQTYLKIERKKPSSTEPADDTTGNSDK